MKIFWAWLEGMNVLKKQLRRTLTSKIDQQKTVAEKPLALQSIDFISYLGKHR
jgi:hypothetical protein